jgi:tRNA(Ile)-lysidine synthase
LLPDGFSGRLCVAFSGGLDSAVLLHALAALRAERPEWIVRAVHVDHQMQASSGEWAIHCARYAESLGIALHVERVVVPRGAQGPEAAARGMRYAALREGMQSGEILLTAHHADDQAETLMLALMRGSGVQGLAAMPPIKEFGRGWHARPLLSFTRASLERWARERDIVEVVDPTNALLRYDRNYLRHEIMPRLRSRWPAAGDNMARSAAHLGEALQLLDEVASADLRPCVVGRCLSIQRWGQLVPSHRRNALRHWLRTQGLRSPSTRKLAGLEHDLLNTELDRIPCVKWEGAVLHWHRGLLYAEEPPIPFPDSHVYEQSWTWRQQSLQLPAAAGRMSLGQANGPGISASRLPQQLVVRFRRGGEKIRLPGRKHRHTLRNLFQKMGVLPWWRDRLPLIYVGDELLAVGDLAWSADFAAAEGEPALRVVLEEAPRWRAEDVMSEA